MNKKHIDFNRSNKARCTVRPVGPKIPDGMLVPKNREDGQVLSGFAESKEVIISTSTPPPKSAAYEYLYAKDVAVLLNVGMSKAYELIALTNEKLKAEGKYIIPGRVPRKLFMEQLY